MISVIMPYWNRLTLFTRSLDRLAELYPDYNLEILVVDDGSAEECRIDKEYPWPVRIIYLPRKEEALNPCIPLNIAVKESKGYILVLTNPEILHTKPIFGEMLDDLISLGQKGYVLAAAWSNDTKRWYCHSSVTEKKNRALGRLPLPPGSGLHFCSMMYKDFFNEIGGFDESYREGQGVEDNDFVWALHQAGAKFRIRDDLIVHHEGTATSWPKGGIERNTEIYRKKWNHVKEAF